jgi:hypothetical protein
MHLFLTYLRHGVAVVIHEPQGVHGLRVALVRCLQLRPPSHHEKNPVFKAPAQGRRPTTTDVVLPSLSLTVSLMGTRLVHETSAMLTSLSPPSPLSSILAAPTRPAMLCFPHYLSLCLSLCL